MKLTCVLTYLHLMLILLKLFKGFKLSNRCNIPLVNHNPTPSRSVGQSNYGHAFFFQSQPSSQWGFPFKVASNFTKPQFLQTNYNHTHTNCHHHHRHRRHTELENPKKKIYATKGKTIHCESTIAWTPRIDFPVSELSWSRGFWEMGWQEKGKTNETKKNLI